MLLLGGITCDLFDHRDDSLSREPNNQLQPNVFTTSETEGEVGAIKHVYAPSNSLLTVLRRQLCCGSLFSEFWWRFTLYVFICFRSVWVAEWPPLGKGLLTRLTICSPCILTFCNFDYFPFWFLGLDFGSDCFSSWSLHTFNFYTHHSSNLTAV